MWVCVPCDVHYASWKRFKQHMVGEHQVSESNLLRRVAQLEAADIFAVRTDAGRWLLYGQPDLF